MLIQKAAVLSYFTRTQENLGLSRGHKIKLTFRGRTAPIVLFPAFSSAPCLPSQERRCRDPCSASMSSSSTGSLALWLPPPAPSHLSVKGWAIYWPVQDAYCQCWRKYERGLSLLFWSSLIMTYLPLSPITHTTNYLDLTEKSIAYLHRFLWLPPLIVSSCLGSALTWKGLWLPDAFRTT